MALTKVSFSMISGAYVNVLDSGAKGDNATNDTAAIQSAINAVFAAGGGTVYFPPGTYLVTGLSLNWGSSAVSVNFVGSGQTATVIKKTGVSVDAMFDLSASASDGTYSEFTDMRITGNTNGDGFTITNLARNVWRNVRVDNCNVGIENRGSLINAFYDCNLLSNVIGYRATKFGGIFCNVIQMFGGSVRGNSDWGFDLGDTAGFYLYGVDIESNGTDATGGGLITRPTCDDEFGYSNIAIKNCWFESNNGVSIYAEACAGLNLSIQDTLILNPRAGNAITSELIGYLTIDRITAAGSGDTVTSQADTLTIRESNIHTIANSSNNYLIQKTQTNAGYVPSIQGGATGEFVVSGDSIKSDSGSVATTSSVAATAFTVSGSIGMYQVFVCLPSIGAGTAYKAYAIIGWDATGAGYISGTNGANLTITLSGSNVQVTQTSGVNQSIYFAYQKIGD
jgi:hypothetical protein